MATKRKATKETKSTRKARANELANIKLAFASNLIARLAKLKPAEPLQEWALGQAGNLVAKLARLCDLLAYTCTKNYNIGDLFDCWPHDYDSNGNFKVSSKRLNEDPAPLDYAHGLPHMVVNRGVVLSGRAHETLCVPILTKSVDGVFSLTAIPGCLFIVEHTTIANTNQLCDTFEESS